MNRMTRDKVVAGAARAAIDAFNSYRGDKGVPGIFRAEAEAVLTYLESIGTVALNFEFLHENGDRTVCAKFPHLLLPYDPRPAKPSATKRAAKFLRRVAAESEARSEGVDANLAEAREIADELEAE